MDIFNTAECFLPEFKFISHVQLAETGFQMALQGIRLVQVDSMHLRRIFCGVLNMVAQKLTKSAKLSLSGVLEAEIKGLVSSALVHDLESSVVLENFQDSSVCFP